jgi:amino acid adenylation domain-containing protein
MTAPSMVDRIEQTVIVHPNRQACELADRSLTYRQLWASAGRLAAHLQAVAKPHRVGVCATGTVAAYIGYLAALRVGATVVPLHPAFPRDRLLTIVDAANVDIVVGDPAILAQLGTAFREAEVPVVEDFDYLTDSEDAVVRRPQSFADFAYILFTSGSTGRPKGVPILHENLVTYLDHVIPRYSVGPGSRLSQTFDLTFDPSVFDIFAAWCTGATLVVPRPGEILMPAKYVTERRISHWFSVPSVISKAMRLGTLPPNSMPGLEYGTFIGEQLTLEQAAAWAAAAPNAVLENVYGPTELTVACTEYRLPTDIKTWPQSANGTIPIGAAYPGIELLIVDDLGRPAEEGELCARGAQRFPGYLAPEDNPGRFLSFDGDRPARVIADAVTPDPSLWYRTGDRVRRESGVLFHLGRLDQQVKHRGYRIELGEIEGRFREHPAVRDAVALTAVDKFRHPVLVAFYTGRKISEAELKEHLGRTLPTYMMPDDYRHRDSMPTNINGKIDRLALSMEITS